MSFSEDISFIVKQYLIEIESFPRFSVEDDLECVCCGCKDNIVDTSVFGCKKFLFCEKCLVERIEAQEFKCPCKNHSMSLPAYYYDDADECICHRGMSLETRCATCTRNRRYVNEFHCCQWCNVELDPNADDFLNDDFYKRKFSILVELPVYKCSNLNEHCDICLKSEILTENDKLMSNELVVLKDLGCRCEGGKVAHVCLSCMIVQIVQCPVIKCTRCREVIDFDRYHSC